MCCSDFWSEEPCSLKQLPTLQELLCCCDDKLLVRVVMEDHVLRSTGAREIAPKRRKAIERRLAKALESMRRLDVGKASRSRVLLPEEAFVLHARSRLVERRVSASQAHRDDAERALEAVRKAGGVVRGGRLELPALEELPPTRPYALSSWEKTLACRVWLAGSWCRRERYQVLASAFWEMTFFGFEYDRAEAGRSREKARAVVGDVELRSVDGPLIPPASTVSEDRQRRARAYGLVEPDRFVDDYRRRLSERVDALNRAARLDFWLRFLDLIDKRSTNTSAAA